jgi:hypothetical protein
MQWSCSSGQPAQLLELIAAASPGLPLVAFSGPTIKLRAGRTNEVEVVCWPEC